jgi:hypothetical protein
MQSSNFHETVAHAVGILASMFRVEADEAMVEGYAIGLHGIDPQRIKAATAAVLQQNRQFMPTAGELRELAMSDGKGFEAITTQAWQCLNHGIDRVGYTGSPNFADGLINATVRHLGGWERVCGLTLEEFEKWFKKDFQQTYLSFARNGCSAEMCRPLVGAVERESARYHGLPNPRSGKIYQLPAPVEVGADYVPVVKSLPAPVRAVRDVPQIEFKPGTEPEKQPSEVKPSKIRRKKDLPKHLGWNEKSDLEFDLTPQQLETQERNKQAILALVGEPQAQAV